MSASVAENPVGTWLGLAEAAVLVAGAGGIGRGIVEGFAALGARVVVVDGDEARARSIAEELRLDETGGGALVADLRNPEACRDVVERAREQLDGLDVFVHAIGMNLRQPVGDFTDEQWRAIVEVNLFSAFWTAQAAGKIMCGRRGGRIVFLSSVAGLLGHKNHAPYAATKGGVNQMMRVMANEWAPYDVGVNAVAPGYVETPLTAEYLARPGIRSGLESLVPRGRLGGVDEVVDAVVFLASRRASFVTGHVLYVDGGRTLV
jgi:NAD(P)-dependent dehydrogenase (short-subunit alcohol dehydrogenase family)